MIDQGKLIIPEARIETTTLCNAKCAMCPRYKMSRSKVDTMSMEHFENLISQLKDLGAELIVLCGMGEPLVDKHMIERIRFLTENGLNSFITTNAQLLNEEMAHNLLVSGLTHLRFSVHGLLPHQYEAIHKGCRYYTVMNNIYNLMQMRDDSIEIHTSVTPFYEENIENVRHYWENCMGVDYLEIWKPHNWINAFEYRPLTRKRKKTCGRPLKGPIEVFVDGRLRACCFDWNGDLTFGDTHKNTIVDIIKHDPDFAKLCEAHLTGNYVGYVCKHCDQRNVGDTPLLYSSRDATCETGKTSTGKNKVE